MATAYEIWGPDEDGDNVLLDTRNGSLPAVKDTVVIQGKDRKVKRLSKRHEENGEVNLVHVGQYDEDEPLPIIIG